MSNRKLIFCLLVFLYSPSFLQAQLTYPVKYPAAVIPHVGDGSRLFFLYMPMEYQDNVGQDTFKIYYVNKDLQNGYKYYLARSVNYGITWTDTQSVNTLSQFEFVISYPDSTNKYMAYGDWKNTKSYFYYSKSTNGGFTFFDSLEVMELGEDKSFIWNEDTNEYWGYVRPYPVYNDCCGGSGCIAYGDGVRKIALMKNSMYFGNSAHWSSRNIIVDVDTLDYINAGSPDYRTQIYYMQVFRSGDDWWGLIGMYRVGNNGGLTNDPPYTYPEYTSDVELMWSDNGEEWYRTNNHEPFIALHDSIRSIYTVGTVVGDSVYFYSSESTILHATHRFGGCNGTKQDSMVNGKYFSIFLYKMSIEKLNEWRPPTEVNVTVTIEGFLDSAAADYHSIRDTLPAQLRYTTTPYGVASTTASVIDSISFIAQYFFPHVNPGSYFLVVSGRNSIETWSAAGIPVSNGSDSPYDFTTTPVKAYGSNLVLKHGKYCVYSGDVNKDGVIDVNDESLIDDDIYNGVFGYVVTDLNGDLVVDGLDQIIVFDNSLNGINIIMP